MKKKAGNFIVFAIAQKCGHFLLAFFMQIVKVHSNFWKKHNKVIFSSLNYYDMLFLAIFSSLIGWMSAVYLWNTATEMFFAFHCNKH